MFTSRVALQIAIVETASVHLVTITDGCLSHLGCGGLEGGRRTCAVASSGQELSRSFTIHICDQITRTGVIHSNGTVMPLKLEYGERNGVGGRRIPLDTTGHALRGHTGGGAWAWGLGGDRGPKNGICQQGSIFICTLPKQLAIRLSLTETSLLAY
jgi:hypothetical protein